MQEKLPADEVTLNTHLRFSYYDHSPSGKGKQNMKETLLHQESSPDPQQWRSMTDLERYMIIERLQIKHPRLKQLMTELSTYAYFAKETDTKTPQCLAILGESGVGKTTLVQSWIQAATVQQELPSGEKQARPYLYMGLPTPTTPKGILAACLTALGDPHSVRGGEWAMMRHLQELLRASPASSFLST
jgi:ABC-type glutathione transport system ATPase component